MHWQVKSSAKWSELISLAAGHFKAFDHPGRVYEMSSFAEGKVLTFIFIIIFIIIIIGSSSSSSSSIREGPTILYCNIVI